MTGLSAAVSDIGLHAPSPHGHCGHVVMVDIYDQYLGWQSGRRKMNVRILAGQVSHGPEWKIR